MDTEWHSIDLETLREDMDVVYKNRSDILHNTAHIETLLEQIILRFFVKGEDDKTKRDIFLNQILKANWCTFAAKMKLVKYLYKDLWTSKEREKITQSIQKVIDIRNAFTHGELVIQSDGHANLTWFKDTNRSRNLDNEFIDEIEANIKDCLEIVEKIDYCLRETRSDDFTILVKRPFRNDSFPCKFWYVVKDGICHATQYRSKASVSGEVKSFDDFLDFVGKTVQYLKKPEVWKELSDAIKANANEGGYRHFVIGDNDKIADHY